MAMEALRIEGLSKNFGALQVLKDLSLTIEAGEYVAVIGPNGAGKTTLMNVISGGFSATAGRVYLYGQEITNMPAHRRTHVGLARSFQLNRLFSDLTVLDNIVLALQGTRFSRYEMFRAATAYEEIFTEAHQLLESVYLWEKRSSRVQAISYGEQRKMEILLALASKPKVLLMDEPTAGLDIGEISDFVNTIRALAKGTTLLFAAHDIDLVFGLAQRVVVLYFGECIAQGTCEEIQANSTVKEIYLGI